VVYRRVFLKVEWRFISDLPCFNFALVLQFSVALALEELGFPTLHTFHMLAHENEEILRMWSKLIVDPAIDRKEPIVGRADLKLIADSGYQAVSDLPSCLFFEQMLEEYSDCKFILTTRESSEIWFRSWETLTKSVTGTMHLGGLLFPTLHLYSRYFRWLYSVINKDPSYLTSIIPKNKNIKENAIASYEEHNRRVREVIPPNQLLEFNVKDGWEPLCAFLEIEQCPTTPFPKSNSARSLQAQSSSAFWIVLVFLVFVASKVCKSFYKNDILKKKVD
jgi:Sulfotransferase domain